MSSLVRCNCGWVSSAVPRAQALRQVGDFNRWRSSLSEDRRRYYPHEATVGEYSCGGCAGWGPYHPAKDGDAPVGCTINQVVWQG